MINCSSSQRDTDIDPQSELTQVIIKMLGNVIEAKMSSLKSLC